MRLGVIADDFTGATDIASFLVNNGMAAIQFNGIPENPPQVNAQALVVSLKTRSCPVDQAVSQSLAALQWLQQQGCTQFYFKYCSTFDSTPQGNIGPVIDALLAALGELHTVISPALPVNGRTVYQGYLFVMDQLLAESGMKNHPVTPMTESNLLRLIEAQACGRAGLVAASVMDQGAEAVCQQLQQLYDNGVSYGVLDCLNEQHLLTQGHALHKMKLVTGGSGLALGLARHWASTAPQHSFATAAGKPQGQRVVVLSGSCSTMTNQQVALYQQKAPAKAIDIAQCMGSEEQRAAYAEQLSQWVQSHGAETLAPLIYATAQPAVLQQIQQQYGMAIASQGIEQLFALLAVRLQQVGFSRFIVAGGETSGVVCQALAIDAFYIGPSISPGVPWVRSINPNVPISLALKSGNFGDEDFFARAQLAFPV
ncbi:3-oxo-tetronate kinase [Yersinia aleksiciae]|uniref:3-oxo-tetronate kinase n=1 Tax=Yersinia aleksiciae TaxID=263819 RepID=A0A0T9URT7_YERAE|nr:3-oxo-tetronate kinase [Yersinia aleksiciae]AKP33619.1 membrane protein [Yersinia aleksiciae]CFQ41041.1 putative pyridoxine biosynthesis protein (probably from glycolaldehide) [Yersinia aleksiciae]CNL64940.1 putative pyridoxine biosynthesis protein (probably from glycolaldehide) [Yersinia aleksiciae]